MGNPNVIMDKAVTGNAAKEYLNLTDEEKTALGKLYDIDGEMMNWWFGEAGESFVDMSNTIEKEIDNMSVFSDNVNGELESAGTNFVSVDDDRAESIEIDSVERLGGIA